MHESSLEHKSQKSYDCPTGKPSKNWGLRWIKALPKHHTIQRPQSRDVTNGSNKKPKPQSRNEKRQGQQANAYEDVREIQHQQIL